MHGRFDAKGDGASFWRGSRTELLFNEGRLEQALESCDEYRDGLMQYMNPTPHLWRSLRAVILDRLGRTDEAIESRPGGSIWPAAGAHPARYAAHAGTLMREDGST